MRPPAWRAALGLPLLSLGPTLISGCGHTPGAAVAPAYKNDSAQQNIDRRIQDIENNPDIPPGDKAPLIAQTRSQGAAPSAKTLPDGH